MRSLRIATLGRAFMAKRAVRPKGQGNPSAWRAWRSAWPRRRRRQEFKLAGWPEPGCGSRTTRAPWGCTAFPLRPSRTGLYIPHPAPLSQLPDVPGPVIARGCGAWNSIESGQPLVCILEQTGGTGERRWTPAMHRHEAREIRPVKTLFTQKRYPEALIVLDGLNAAFPNEKHIMLARPCVWPASAAA